MTGRVPDERVPGYLGRVLDGLGPVGTCFQVAPGVLATAWHVLEDLGAACEGARVKVDPLAGGAAFEAVVKRVDRLRDLAILIADCRLPTVAGPLVTSDEMPLRTHVTVTGHAVLEDRGSTYRFLTAVGQWAGGTTRDDAIPLGRIIADRVVPGMSGAPAIRDSDGAVVGVVSGRYNSSDGWPPSTAWVARTEDLAVLLDGIADVPVAAHPLSGDRRPPSVPQIPGWAVPRTEEMEEIITAVCAQPGAAVGITTGLEGAGGFGKTMLVELACADERVREHFGERVYTVTIGRDVRESAAIAMKVIEVIRFITGQTATYTDPGMAGDELGRLLDQAGQRTLLVLDDVWADEQLDPFLRGGRDCVRLVTTRRPDILPDDATRVLVDKMTPAQARAVLVQDLPPLPEPLARNLIAVTGQWALLLRLANRWMWRQVKTGADIATAGEHLLGLLREEGPTATDRSRPPPDPADPIQRRKMVRATLQAATGLLAPDQRQSLAELGIFAEDEPVPVLVAARLWQATSGLSEPRARDLCYELGSLSLLTIRSHSGGFLVLHDVIREYLRHELGSDRITALNGTLTDAIQDELPRAEPLSASALGPQAAWWELPTRSRYLSDHIIEHLIAAQDSRTAELAATDLRWVVARLQQSGPSAPYGDLSLIGTPKAARRQRLLGQSAHLLAATDPPYSQIDILCSRVSHDADWGPEGRVLQAASTYPSLVTELPLPDLPGPALNRILNASDTAVLAVAVAPDGTWLAAGDGEGTVWIWDAFTGERRVTITHPDLTSPYFKNRAVRELAVAPDGTWLATSGDDSTTRIWDPTTGEERAVLPQGYATNSADGLAVAPDGTWLATSRSGTIRIWDTSTWKQDAVLTTARLHHMGVQHVAVAPDGTWLASVINGGTVLILDSATGTQRASLSGGGHPVPGKKDAYYLDKYSVYALALAPDGTWLATGCSDGVIRIWDTSAWKQLAVLTGHQGDVWKQRYVWKVAVAPDGTWLASAGSDGTVRIWDTSTWKQRSVLTGHEGSVGELAVAPDGTWLATGGSDGTVRIWDPTIRDSAGHRPTALTSKGHRFPERHAVCRVPVTPDDAWLASAEDDGIIRIWDPGTGRQGVVLAGHRGPVHGVAAAPDGTWLASAGSDGTARIWNTATGRQFAALTGASRGASGVFSVAVAPDGTWLATADGWGPVRIWDTSTWKQLAVLIGHSGKVHGLAFVPDGTWLASVGSDGTLRIWDTSIWKQHAILTSQDGSVHGLAVAPDSAWLATGGSDGTVRIWDTSKWEERAVLTGHAGAVHGLAVAPDSTWLATVGDDRTLRIWDQAAGHTSALMRVHGPLANCEWSPSGKSIAAIGAAGCYCFTFRRLPVQAVLTSSGLGTPPRPPFREQPQYSIS